MAIRRHSDRRIRPDVECCERRTLAALVFVLNGNSFNAAGSSGLTAGAAAVLRRSGNRVVEVSYPAIHSAAAYNALAARLTRLAAGRPVGIVGFSAGGALALRLSTTPGLKVNAVLDYYGVPDAAAILARHTSVRPISGLAPFRPGVVALFSGPVATKSHVVAAFGRFDPNVRADASAADLSRDLPSAHVYTYDGGHGVGITASRPALEDFLAHLG